MKKTSVFISLVAVASLMVISCKKTTTPTPAATTPPPPAPLSINSTPQVDYSIGSTNHSYVANSTGTIESSSSTSGGPSSTPGTPGHIIYGASIDDGGSMDYMAINMGTLTFPYGTSRPDTSSFRAFFTTGAKTYSNGGVAGIEVTMYDTAYWSTSLGSQTGSTFNIDAVQQQYLSGPTGDQYMKFKASFTCKLYTSAGASKTITNGIYIGYFDNM